MMATFEDKMSWDDTPLEQADITPELLDALHTSADETIIWDHVRAAVRPEPRKPKPLLDWLDDAQLMEEILK
jgi:hypothetical protein